MSHPFLISHFVAADLIEIYTSIGRYYHNLDNILDMLEAGEAFGLTEHQKTAIWFHDAVYVAGHDYNEFESAGLARRMLKLPEVDIKQIEDIIMSTAIPHIPLVKEAEIVIDLDLAGFSADYDVFLKNSEDVRKEFPPMDDNSWAIGRIRILMSYRSRKPFYYTEHYKGLTGKALDNISREINRLQGIACP